MKAPVRSTFSSKGARVTTRSADLPICPPADLPTAYSSFLRTFDPFEAQY